MNYFEIATEQAYNNTQAPANPLSDLPSPSSTDLFSSSINFTPKACLEKEVGNFSPSLPSKLERGKIKNGVIKEKNNEMTNNN